MQDSTVKHNNNDLRKVALVVKKLPARAVDARDLGSIPGSEIFPGVGNGKPFQSFCLQNPSTDHKESDKTETYTQQHPKRLSFYT